MEIKVKFTKIGSTPAFCVPGRPDDSWSRVFNSQYHTPSRLWIFPAYPPFLENIISDIKKIDKNALSEEEADKARTHGRSFEHWNAFVREHPTLGPLNSYEHQLVGTAELLAYYRWYLRWEMGTGKTKVVIDALQHLREKAVVICPLIAVGNWAAEADLHSAGTLSTITITGTARQKEKKLLEAREKDVVIVSYDTARIYGVPVLCSEAVKLKKKEGMGSSPQHVLVLDKVAMLTDDKEQMRLLLDFYAMRKTSVAIAKEVDEIVGPYPPFLSFLDFSVLVLDEAHRVKSITSQRTKIISKLSSKASRRYLLSGTPTMGDPRDFYTQLRILSPALMPEEWHTFVQKFCVASPYNKHVVTGYKNLHIINQRVNSVSSERKLLDCVDLPERTYQNIYYDLEGTQRADYNQAAKDQEILLPEQTIMDLSMGAVKLNKLLQICSGFYYRPKQDETLPCDTCEHLHDCFKQGIMPSSKACVKPASNLPKQVVYKDNPKLKALDDLLEDLLDDPSNKVIIWCVFTTELDMVEELIKKRKYGHVRVDGSNTKNIRMYEQIFNSDASTRVYLAQIHTGIAITLNVAKYSVYYSRSWSPEDWLQSRGRNYRIGQKEKTVEYCLVGNFTVERQQLHALKNRQDISDTLTKRINCLLCERYEFCLKNSIEPWSQNCKFVATAQRLVTHAKALPEPRYNSKLD